MIWLCERCCSDKCPDGAYPQEKHCEGFKAMPKKDEEAEESSQRKVQQS